MIKLGNRIASAVSLLLLLIFIAACGQSSDNAKTIKAVEPGEPSKVFSLTDPQKPEINIQSSAPLQGGAPLTASSIIAQVDDVIMTKGQLDTLEKQKMAEMKGKIPVERLKEVRPEVRRQIIDYFIVNNLLNNEIKRLKIQISEQELKESMEALKSSLPNGVTIEDMMKKNKISQKEFRQKVITGLSVRKLVSMQPLSKLKVTDNDVSNFYKNNPDKFKIPELVHARHILIAVNKVDDVAAKARKKEKAEGLRKQLVSGGDFAEMAKMGSDCPSKENGGDLGQFPRGQMVKPFDDAAFSQKKDEIGPVIETEFGYHIIQVLDRKPSRVQPLDKNMQTKIFAYLQQQKELEAYNALMNQLKAKAKIVVSNRME